MEEQEIIPRRTAAAGLSVLGALALALVGTIVFRIVHATPRRATPTTEATWASTAPAEPLPAPPMADGQVVSNPLPPVTPIPTIADDSGGADGIPATSTSEAPSPPNQEQTPVDERPQFLAPAGR